MSARKRLRSVTRSACAVFALVAAVGVGPVVAPAPARAADTVRDLQWHLDALKIPEAHRLTKGRGVTVAVIDSGVDAGHPDLRGQVLRGRGFGAGAAADGRTDPDREAGHGTGMAGIIAGRGGGDMHALGIAPEAKILPIGLGDGGLREAPTGVRWAVDSGADVINLSLGAHGDDPEMVEAVRYALGKNVVVVASTGNRDSGYREIPVPASVPGVLAVGGATRSGGLWDGTVTGPAMAISAPGEDIIAPAPSAASPNGYLVSDGTSNSSAIVSGIAALIRARYPDLDAANVVNRLVATARDRGPKGRDPEYGFGSVDVMAALTRSVPAVQANPLAAAAGASASPGAPTGEAEGKDDDGPAVSIGLADNAGIQIVLCLLAVLVAVAVVVILLVVNRRSRRRARAGAPPGVQRPGQPVPGVYPPPGTYQPHPPHGGFRPPPGPQPYPTAAPGQHPYPPAPGQHPYPPAPGGPPVTAPPYGPPHQPGPPGPVPPTPPGTPPTDPQPRQ
ncbi:S8 family serine peptidase [Micromonospora costi]|uniref:Type VII secretion-associated serine protease mycosin n=1 Tax=Micromonospora costi TaxID=1530042 RepID=A0A3B0ADJ5_9ACTN|nr:S8 family serine peptidase [Micromonospora costi]RKN58625.1 type VII secretion-associated serine protease mycosin [Micromonospora costi]